MNASRLRCAVYTRKSTDEGVDQDFNSLDAQREACEAFILSQAGLGWCLVPSRYNDGGISGGTLERPALKRLLQDIRDGKIDVVVVYKIDRLTRSLTDFSKIVEVLEEANASFVSVTQAFNTTTSMGRLTLNVLLSFAQFEREVTAERIRDKIAASKKKGMWMGGNVPFGYRVENRKLLANESEAPIVRHLFERYLDLKSVRALADEAKANGLVTRTMQRRDGSENVSRPFGRGNLYHLLANPIYVGRIRHRDQTYEGEHAPIVDSTVFKRAQELLAAQAPARRHRANGTEPHLLVGLIYNEAGELLRAVHANKKGVRYRYYVSKDLIEGRKSGSDGWRLPAAQLDSLVEHQLKRILSDRPRLTEWIGQSSPSSQDFDAGLEGAERLKRQWATASAETRRLLIRSVFRRILLRTGCISLELDCGNFVGLLLDRQARFPEAAADAVIRIDVPVSQKRRGVEMRMVLTDGSNQATRQDTALINLVLRAYLFLGQLTDGAGRSLEEVASLNGTAPSEISRLLPLAFLSPRLIDAILCGTQPVDLTAQRLARFPQFPLSWNEQAALLGC